MFVRMILHRDLAKLNLKKTTKKILTFITPISQVSTSQFLISQPSKKISVQFFLKQLLNWWMNKRLSLVSPKEKVGKLENQEIS